MAIFYDYEHGCYQMSLGRARQIADEADFYEQVASSVSASAHIQYKTPVQKKSWGTGSFVSTDGISGGAHGSTSLKRIILDMLLRQNLLKLKGNKKYVKGKRHHVDVLDNVRGLLRNIAIGESELICGVDTLFVSLKGHIIGNKSYALSLLNSADDLFCLQNLLGEDVKIQQEIQEMDVNWIPRLMDDLIRRNWLSKRVVKNYKRKQGRK